MFEIKLPDEIWMCVFEFLSHRDKLSVRSTCTYFKILIDHWSLWKDCVVVLKKSESYTTHFFRTLRQRKIKSIVVHKAKANTLKQIVTLLPWMSSVTLVQCRDGSALLTLGALKHLERLVIHQSTFRSLTSSLLSLSQLTHLCLCEVEKASVSEITYAISQLVNLTSLQYHEDKNPLHKPALHSMLRRLPKLKHLSLKLGPPYGILPDDYFGLPGEFGLSSLELLKYGDPCLSPSALNALPSLTKLTVHNQYLRVNPLYCRIIHWFQGLHVLSELNVSLGFPLQVYAESIPRTVQRLYLRGMKADLEAVRIIAKQVPDLLHLHLDLCCHDNCGIIKEIPQIFPKLQVLKVRHQNVTESVFLQLQHLSHLQQLVILDAPQNNSPTFLDLTQKLKDQTNNRIHVLQHNLKDQTSCPCSFN